MSQYWDERKDLTYYKRVHHIVNHLCPKGGTLLDVGAGISLGCKYLEFYHNFKCTALELRVGDTTLSSVEMIYQDIESWNPGSRIWDVVLCLQLLEHLADPQSVAQMLLSIGHIVVVSVPYMWKKGVCEEHLQDPVSIEKVQSWFNQKPNKIIKLGNRMIVAYTK